MPAPPLGGAGCGIGVVLDVGLFLLGLALLGDGIHEHGNGAVAGDIAGSAEGVLSDVQSNHQALHGLVKAQHGLQNAQSSHNSAAGDAGGGHHGDAQHQDEGEHLAEGDGLAHHHQHSDGAAGQGDGGTGQVNGSAQGAHKLRDGSGDAIRWRWYRPGSCS